MSTFFHSKGALCDGVMAVGLSRKTAFLQRGQVTLRVLGFLTVCGDALLVLRDTRARARAGARTSYTNISHAGLI